MPRGIQGSARSNRRPELTLLERLGLTRLWRRREFRVGDPVIYRVAKIGPHPGPRAIDVAPSAHGEDYSYLVDKLWRVERIRPDGKLVLTTRRGKRHVVDPDARQLRRPSWLEQWRFRDRFPAPRRLRVAH